MLVLLALLLELAGALPFVTTWRTTQTNEAIVLPPIYTNETAVTIDWGDGTPNSNITAAQGSISLNHTYVSPGLYNVSMEGQIFWKQADSKTTTQKLVDISSWGDGFLVQYTGTPYTWLFAYYPNLQVSASPDSQPKFLAGASLGYMFASSAFNSPLNWDLTNVTSLMGMFSATPLNQPINFRNTQGIQSIARMFAGAQYFNQPFHFDASGLIDASWMFFSASSFNQVVNLTNSSLLTDTSYMFENAISFNQLITCDTSSVTTMERMLFNSTNFNKPVNFNTQSVTTMQAMFYYATNFNQPVSFDTKSVTTMMAMFYGARNFNQPVNFDNLSQVIDMTYMFHQAESFNQPINFDAPKLNATSLMFYQASSFNQPVVMNAPNVRNLALMFAYAYNFSSTVTFTSTAKANTMHSVFYGANGFTQDLSSWDTQNVTGCETFCDFCGLPAFPRCNPCVGMRYTVGQLTKCSSLAPTPPTQSSAPSSSAPSPAAGVPSSSAPSTLTQSSAPSSRAPSPAAGVAPSVDPSNSSSVSAATAAAAFPALAWAVLVLSLVTQHF